MIIWGQQHFQEQYDDMDLGKTQLPCYSTAWSTKMLRPFSEFYENYYLILNLVTKLLIKAQKRNFKHQK